MDDRSRRFGLSLSWVVWALAGVGAISASAQTELRNDAWEPAQTAVFQQSFAVGETAASRLTPAGPCPCPVMRVQFLFGGAQLVETITLHVWDDTAETVQPGTKLFTGNYPLTGANDQLQEIDLSFAGLTVPGTFRVGIEFQHDGLPSVGQDEDGITTGRNFIDLAGFGWSDAGLVVESGDWIIRATVPEPSGTVLQLAALVTMVEVRRRRRLRQSTSVRGWVHRTPLSLKRLMPGR